MAHYWYNRNGAGDGNWGTATNWMTAPGGGGVECSAVPGVGDSVYFESGYSGNCVINVAAVCASMDCTGYTGTITNTGGIDCRNSVKLVSAMGFVEGAGITFVNTVTSAFDGGGKTVKINSFAPYGGTTTITGGFTTTYAGSITMYGTTVISSSVTVSWGGVWALNSGSKLIMQANSTLIFTHATLAPFTVAGNPLAFDCHPTSIMRKTGTGIFKGISGSVLGIVDCNNNTTFQTSSTAGWSVYEIKLTGGRTYTFQTGKTFTVTGELRWQGSYSSRITITSSTATPFRVKKDSGTVDCRYINLSYCTASTTGGVTFNAGATSTLNTCSGWLIQSLYPNRYWIAQVNTFWATDTAWSYTDGGPACNDPPTAADDVYFTANSGTAQCIQNNLTYNRCRNFKCLPGYNGTFVLTQSFNVAGSFELNPEMTFISNNKNLSISIPTNGTLGTYNKYLGTGSSIFCYGNVTLASDTYLETITVGGTLNQATFNLTATNTIDLYGEVNIGENKYLASYAISINTGATFNCHPSAKMVITVTTGMGFNGQGKNLPIIECMGPVSFQTSGFTTVGLILKPGCSYTFGSGLTFTITGDIAWKGTAGNLISLNTVSGSGQFTLTKASGKVDCDYLSITNCVVSGGAVFYKGLHTTTYVNSSGWTNGNMPSLTQGNAIWFSALY